MVIDFVNILAIPRNIIEINLFKQGFIADFKKLSDSALQKNFGLLFDEYAIALLYDISFPVYPYVGTENTACRGGDFFGLAFIGKDPVLDIRDLSLTNCKLNSYNISQIPSQRFSKSNFLSVRTDSYEPNSRPWYVMAKEKGKPGWTEPYTFSGTADEALVGITAFAPFYDSSTKQLLGVFGCDAPHVSDFLILWENFGTNSAIFIVSTTTGDIVGTTKGLFVTKNSLGEYVPIKAENSDNPLIRTVSRQLLGLYGNWANVPHLENLRDPTALLITNQFTDKFGLNCMLVMIQPTSDYQSFTATDLTVTLVVGLLCFGVLISIILFLIFLSPKLELWMKRRKLKTYFVEREERKKEFDYIRKKQVSKKTDTPVNSVENKGDYSLPRDSKYSFHSSHIEKEEWYIMAMQEENGLYGFEPKDEDDIIESLSYSQGDRLNQVVLAVLVVIIVVNCALWFAWTATTRTNAISSAEFFIGSATSTDAWQVSYVIQNAWLPGWFLRSDYISSTGTMLDVLKPTEPFVTPVPTVVPDGVNSLQTLLCSYYNIFPTASKIYVATVGASELGCSRDSEGYIISAKGKYK